MKRKATAVWKGSGKEGSGTLNTPSGALDNLPYSTKARFENEDGTKGTNPEELIAAAHAGCFIMALSFQLGGEGFTPDKLDCTAHVNMVQHGVDWEIDRITLDLEAEVPDISKDTFMELANKAKAGCPISKVLAGAEIVLNAELK